MKLWLTILTLLALGVASTHAQERGDSPNADSKAPSTKARNQYEALVKEYDAARESYFKEYQKAKTDAEREKLSYPQPEKYAKRFLDLAKANPKDDAAVDALVWIGQHYRNSGNEIGEALDLLVKDYVTSSRLTDVAQALVYAQTDHAQDWLRAVMEKSPHADVRGNATYALGKLYQRNSESAADLNDADRIKMLKQWLGEKSFEQLKSNTADGWQKLAERLFEQVIEKYADVKHYRGTLADAAKGELFEIRNLAIGKVAPEIEGEDVDGKKFRLSDYRGKVVVIDFWGDW